MGALSGKTTAPKASCGQGLTVTATGFTRITGMIVLRANSMDFREGLRSNMGADVGAGIGERTNGSEVFEVFGPVLERGANATCASAFGWWSMVGGVAWHDVG